MRLQNISFKHKILLLLFIPLLAFIGLGIVTITSSLSTYNEMNKLDQLIALSTVNSDLVHELQKERGMTAGFIGSKGKKFNAKLKQQRELTNEKIQKRNNYWRENQFTSKDIITLNSTINDRLNNLETIRAQVDQQSIILPTALGFYTQTNAQLLSISTFISEISTNAIITKEVVAYYNFIQGKERAGIERAVMSNTFANDLFAPSMFKKFITLVSEQTTYFNNFTAFSNTQNKHFYTEQLNNQAVIEVEQLRNIAQEKMSVGQFNVDAEYWFAESTKRIGLLKEIENKISSTLILLTNDVKNTAFVALLVYLIVIILLVIISIGMSFMIIRELNQQVNELTSVMSRIRDENDLTLRVKVKGNNEMALIASAFNATLEKFSGAIEQISSTSTMLSATAEETSKTCDYNAGLLFDQQNEIGLIATAIEELSATVKEVAANTQLATDSAKEADIQSQDGLQVVQTSYLSIQALADEINALADKITNLHQSSKNITQVVDVIKSVAEQTNLLALNAAIEAARAGEQGRGFAVVADEVRTLAQRTQESTSEIENFIVSLQSDANSAFNVIANSQKMAADVVDNAKMVENKLGDISHSVSEIFSITEQVAVATEEQATVTHDIAQNIVNVEQKSIESTSGSTQITATAQEQAHLAVSLQEIATTFKI